MGQVPPQGDLETEALCLSPALVLGVPGFFVVFCFLLVNSIPTQGVIYDTWDSGYLVYFFKGNIFKQERSLSSPDLTKDSFVHLGCKERPGIKLKLLLLGKGPNLPGRGDIVTGRGDRCDFP